MNQHEQNASAGTGRQALPGGRWNRLMPWLAALVVILVGTIVYLGSLHSPFTADDVYVTYENYQAFDPSEIPRYFTHDFDRILPKGSSTPGEQHSRFGLYRPILVTSFSIDALLSGMNPLGWRLTNLILNLLASLLVLGLARKLLGSWIGALATGLVFAVHPVHTEAVATLLGGRADILATIFVVSSWWLFLSAGDPGERSHSLKISGSVFLFLLGLLSKENAAVLPGVLFLGDWILRRKPIGKILVRIVPHLAVLGAYVIVRLIIIGGLTVTSWSDVFGPISFWHMLLVMFVIQATYVRLVLFPYPLEFQFCYRTLPTSASLTTGLLSLVFILALAGLAVWLALRGRRNRKPSVVAAGILVFFLCLLPVSHLIPFAVIMAERFLYLPSVAVCLVLGWLAREVATRKQWLLYAVGLPILLVCGALTVLRNADWADLDRLWNKTAACAPDAYQPYNNIGTARLRAGRPAEALAFFEKAARISPTSPQPYYNAGLALQKLGRTGAAERAYRKALTLAPDHTPALLNLGTILEARGDLEGAKRLYLLARRGDASDPAPYVDLGNIFQRQGRLPEAEKLFRQALRIAPNLAAARFNLARLLAKTGRTAAAEKEYRKLIARHPDHAMAYNNLANIYKDHGQKSEAYAAYAKALQADPGCAPAHYNLANLQMSDGKPGPAAEHYSRAIQISPEMTEAFIGLGYARLTLGQIEKAKTAAHEAARLAPDDARVEKLLELLARSERPEQ